PMGSYITGLGLWVQGQSLHQNSPWNFSFGNEGDVNWNVTHGNMPTPAVLLDARKTSIVIGLILCLTTYWIVTMLSNWIGGTVAGVFLAVHPLTIYLATIAVSDMSFTAIVALSVLAALYLAKRPQWWLALVLGILLGMGAALKLSPIFVAIGLAIVGVAILAYPIANRIPVLSWLWNRFGAGAKSVQRLGIMLCSLPFTAGAFFVLSYPYLWPDPIGRTRVLFDFRRAEMANQSRIWGDQAISSRIDALHRTWQMLEDRYSASGHVIAWLGIDWGTSNGQERGFDLPFALVGCLILVAIALYYGFRTPHLLALTVMGAQIAIILLGININFNRYYLPIAFFFAVGLGVGVGTVWTGLVALLHRWQRRRSQPMATEGPPPSPQEIQF
ncbi:MAG TPA: hypothetical protein PK819_09620, partial [Thermomicrobiales bacterium]|nr:hypothetical protein [Thermomicrobiales bacterium]